jgi:hypothetical protein
MKIFVIVSTRGASRISAAMREQKLAHFDIREDAWLLASNSTTREIADGLGMREGQNGSGLVCLIEGYSGRLPKDAWEWMRIYEAKSE